MIELDEEVSIAFRCPAWLRQAAAERAEAELVTTSAWLRRLVRDNVRPRGPEGEA